MIPKNRKPARLTENRPFQYFNTHLKWTETTTCVGPKHPQVDALQPSLFLGLLLVGETWIIYRYHLIYESLITPTPRRAARAKQKSSLKYRVVLLQYYKVSTSFFFQTNISRMLLFIIWFTLDFDRYFAHQKKQHVSSELWVRPELTAMTHRQRLQAGKGNCSRIARGLEDHPRTCKSLT